MKLITAFFQLVRWRNLLIVFLTQWFVWLFVVNPMKSWSSIPVFLGPSNFFVLTLSTIFIAAAGYIINDYFDVKIDLINKPTQVIIERLVTRRTAILLHSALNVLGFLLAFYLAMKLNNYWVVSIQFVCTIFLWFYSTTFKRQFVTGNVVVAMLTGLTILIVAVYEPSLYPHINMDYFFTKQGKVLVNPFTVIAVYTYFAFMLTWMREIVKDMEDFKGDAEDGCVTMPIRIGLKKSTQYVILLGVLATLPLMVASFKLMLGNWVVLGIYIGIALIVPMITWLFFLPKKATSIHFSRASRWLKIIMLLGIASLLLYYWLQYFL